jgi:hypothetical protein
MASPEIGELLAEEGKRIGSDVRRHRSLHAGVGVRLASP